MKKLSVVIPFYNEINNVTRIYNELLDAHKTEFSNYALEILFMDNHSTDGSHAEALSIAEKDPRAMVIRLSRNFGYQANIITGFAQATGDAVVQLDADGEDDPKLIKKFITEWENGAQVVYGVRKKRAESFVMTFTRKVFYRILRASSDIDLPVDSGDFRLLDRRVVDHLKLYKESNLYLRGLVSHVGYTQKGVDYERRPRFSGESKFSLMGYFTMAFDGITSFSRKPLSLVGWAGFLLSAFSAIGIVFYFALYFTIGINQPGFMTLVLLILFLAGIQLFCIGLLGIYLGRVFDEVKSRPRSVIESTYSKGTERARS